MKEPSSFLEYSSHRCVKVIDYSLTYYNLYEERTEGPSERFKDSKRTCKPQVTHKCIFTHGVWKSPKILFILGFTQKSAKTSDFWRESSVSKYGAECFEESV